MNSFYINYEDSPFLKTSQTGAFVNFLNWRCEIFLTQNKKAINNNKILDIASHDGRFSYACLKLGANHVVGVEPRPHLVKHAEKNLTTLGFKPKKFKLVQDDIFNYLPTVKTGSFETIICFGFFYHTIRQVELLREIRRIKPNCFIFDTYVLDTMQLNKQNIFVNPAELKRLLSITKIRDLINPGTLFKKSMNVLRKPVKTSRKLMNFKYEDNNKERSTIDSSGLVAVPTEPLIEELLKTHGFSFRKLQWREEEINNWTHLEEYRSGKILSYICRQ